MSGYERIYVALAWVAFCVAVVVRLFSPVGQSTHFMAMGCFFLILSIRERPRGR